jgi:AcrR family transcriptional regulator
MSTEQKDRILVCACELYLQGGLDGFSMRKLAGRLGVTAPSLYRHFDSREKVLVEVVLTAYRKMAEYLYKALEGKTAGERFRLAGESYLRFALENPRLYDVLFAPPDRMGWQGLPAEIENQACAVGQFWNDRVRECMDAGILRRGDPEDISVTLWTHAHGLLTLYLRGVLQIDEPGFQELYMSSSRRLLAGVATQEYAASLVERDQAVHLNRPEARTETGHVRYKTGT